MAFKGTERRSAFDIAAEIEAVGGHLNAYTSREQTAYFARVLHNDLRLGVDILADILQYPAFDPEELAREKDVIVQEIGQAEDTPDDILFDHLQAVAYPDQAMGRAILGTVERVTALGGEDLRRFMGQHYRAGQMILCATGAVSHEQLVALAEETFATLPPGPAMHLEPARYRGGDFREIKDLEQAHLAVAFPGLAYHDTDFYASQVFSSLLGGGMSSRLFQEIRERRGLCYSIFSFASSYSDGGMFGVYAGTGADQVNELAQVTLAELKRIGRDVEAEELARAKAQLKAGLLMSMESPSSRAEQLARQLIVFGRTMDAEEIAGRIDAVDLDVIRRLADRLIQPDGFTLAALGPIEKLDPYEQIVAQLT